MFCFERFITDFSKVIGFLTGKGRVLENALYKYRLQIPAGAITGSGEHVTVMLLWNRKEKYEGKWISVTPTISLQPHSIRLEKPVIITLPYVLADRPEHSELKVAHDNKTHTDEEGNSDTTNERTLTGIVIHVFRGGARVFA